MKDYSLFYATESADFDKIARRVGQLLGMNVTLRTSSYVGDYATCEGPAADYLSVRSRNRRDFPAEIDYKKFHTQLLIRNTKGKNFEKELRHNNIKNRLSKHSEFCLITEAVIESK